MFRFDPGLNIFSEPLRKFPDLVCLPIRDRVGSFVIGNVSLFTKSVQRAYCRAVRSHGVFQRLDYAVVMISAFGLKSCARKRRGSQLQAGIVSDIKPPIADQPWSL